MFANLVRRSLIALPAICSAWAILLPTAGIAEETKAPEFADGPWVSDVLWIAPDRLVATQSQGLPLRPATVVTLDAATPSKFQVAGEAEKSLWSVVAIDAQHFIVSDYGGSVYAVQDGKAAKFDLKARWIRALAISADKRVLAGAEDGKLIELDLEKKTQSRSIDAHASAIMSITFSHSGDKLATTASNGSIKIFNWPALDQTAELKAGDAVWSALFSADDTQLITAGSERTIDLWNLATNERALSIAACSDWVSSLVALPGSSLIVAGGMDGNVTVVDYGMMHSVARAKVAESGIWSMALSPDASRLAVGTRKNGVSIIDVADWKQAAETAAIEMKKIGPPSPKP
ncbi:MAG: hypothetical protein KDB22_17180 [Planctomycetales bacterium]|nr:hypothetical protein [Planctomycetales bacterium]